MKKLTLIILALVVLLPVFCWAAAAPGTVTQTTSNIPEAGIRQVIFTCIGSVDDGAIPVTTTSTSVTSFIKGYKLVRVDAYPTSGGTAPDEADVFILDANGIDLLGCVDGSTTPYAGAKLIHATLPKSALPDIYVLGKTTHYNYEPFITGSLRLKVINQATNSADYTIVLTFTK
jgi:hypothetical protein